MHVSVQYPLLNPAPAERLPERPQPREIHPAFQIGFAEEEFILDTVL